MIMLIADIVVMLMDSELRFLSIVAATWDSIYGASGTALAKLLAM